MKRSAVCGAALLALVGAASAADEPRAAVEQRVKLVARTLADSPAAQRIVASGNGVAMSHLNEGRLHQARAEDALAKGDLATARKAVDEALMHLGMARRLVPDAPARQAALRQRHEQWLVSLERLLEAWRVRSGAAVDNDWLDASSRLGDARTLGANGRYDEASQQLDAAERRILAGLARVHAGRELDYSVRAATPAEAFQLEMAQHSELSQLVPIAVRDLQPPAAAQTLIERYQQTARTLHAQAVQRFEAGDHATALAQIRNATLYLQRALAAAGVSTPPPAEDKP